MEVHLIDLIRFAIKDDVAQQALLQFVKKEKGDKVVEALNGWSACGALILKHDVMNQQDTNLRATSEQFERPCKEDGFTVESFILANGSRLPEYEETTREGNAQLAGIAKDLKNRDIIGKVETQPVRYSKEVFKMRVAAPKVIETNYADIGHLFKLFQLGNVASPPTSLRYVPTSLIFLTDRLNILSNARSPLLKFETLLQILLYWSVITSSEIIAREYLHSPEIWANAITMFQSDKLLGKARFRSIRAWFKSDGWDLEKNKCHLAVDFWLGPEAMNEEDNDIRAELLRELRKMIADLQIFHSKVARILRTSGQPSDRRTPSPDSHRPTSSVYRPISRTKSNKRGPRPRGQVKTMFGEDR